MTRSRFGYLAAVLVVLVLVGALAAGGCKPRSTDEAGGDGASNGSTPSADPTPNLPTPEVPGSTYTTPPPANTPPVSTPPANTPPPPATLTVRLYWIENGDRAIGIERQVPYTKAIATASINALIAGPTAAEKQTWGGIYSNIPAGTKLLGITIANGIAKIDFSKEFETDSGSFGVLSRLAQVVYTLDQFASIDSVEFYIEGEKVTLFTGQGIVLDGPQTLDDYQDYLPIDN